MMDSNSGAQKNGHTSAWQVIKFTLFSISAGAIQALGFWLLDIATQLTYWPKYLIALILSVVWNFTLNRRYTFHSAANVPKAMFLVFLYYLVFTPLSTWWGDALTSTAIGWNEYIVLGGTMIINFVTEFLYQRFVVFRHTINTNDIAQRKTGEK